jgi:hypothetical protein
MGRSNSTSEPRVTSAMINRHRQGWNAFTQAVVVSCVSVAALLLLMLFAWRVL